MGVDGKSIYPNQVLLNIVSTNPLMRTETKRIFQLNLLIKLTYLEVPLLTSSVPSELKIAIAYVITASLVVMLWIWRLTSTQKITMLFLFSY